MRSFLVSLVVCSLVFIGCINCNQISSPPQINKLHETPLLHGVNLPSMEWKSLGEPELEMAAETVYDIWKANVIRLPMSQDRWFGKAPEQTDGGAAYRDKIDRLVQIATTRHKYIILDLHWSNAGQWGKFIHQHKMPDQLSGEFWDSVSKIYKNNPYVMYDLYNEPHDVSWDVWRNGGEVSDDATYTTPGMMGLLKIVRDNGARNLVVISGLSWSNDFRGILEGYAIPDENIIYGIHVYPGEFQWSHFDCIVGKYPVMFTEFGAQPEFLTPVPKVWLDKFWDYADTRGLGWVEWAFHPQLHPLIKDWSMTPTDYSGVYLKEKLDH
jgi:endoglucanase